MSMFSRRLRRSDDDKVLAGVCGGVADHLGLDPGALRIAYAVVSVFPAMSLPGIAVYVLLWFLIPGRAYD